MTFFFMRYNFKEITTINNRVQNIAVSWELVMRFLSFVYFYVVFLRNDLNSCSSDIIKQHYMCEAGFSIVFYVIASLL